MIWIEKSLILVINKIFDITFTYIMYYTWSIVVHNVEKNYIRKNLFTLPYFFIKNAIYKKKQHNYSDNDNITIVL